MSEARSRHRSLTLTAEMLQAYSRRGNYHSDPEEARRVGLPGLLAQGMQAAGPAYALLLDEWGEEFLEHGELDLRFVGTVWEGQSVDAEVRVAGDTADVSVTNTSDGRAAVVGAARRTSPASAVASGA
jgi:acyl dehydratase